MKKLIETKHPIYGKQVDNDDGEALYPEGSLKEHQERWDRTLKEMRGEIRKIDLSKWRKVFPRL